MDFNKPYNRQEFMNFLQHSFLPDDFIPSDERINLSKQLTYTTKVTKLGSCESLDLVVYEMEHNSTQDARVSLSKEAFRILAEEIEDRALVIFVPEDDCRTYRFSFIEMSFEWADDSSKIIKTFSNPRRYSYLLGESIACYTPHKYLEEKGKIVNDEDLHSRFSVEVLTKEFYNELSDWYAWAIKVIRFPNNLNDDKDDDKYNNESAIRLITRLIFVWFLKQRHLIPDEFFDEQYIANHLIEGFNPNVMVDLFSKSNESKYYKAILQNLFFAMLNSPITPEGSNELSERRFRKGRNDYDNNKLMRYEDYFSNPQLFVDLANHTVPFLNGGLFDCLDDKDNDMYYDGFSDREKVRNSLIVPDYLFFGENVGKDMDLSGWYGDPKKKKVNVQGILLILKKYNFTVEENTPFDKEVSLDPELLGKVFENLLASYNPETQTTARKQTGSFYTPREIVQYMVDESIIAHLKRTVGEELESKYRSLLAYSDEQIDFTAHQRKQIMQSLYKCKILDPACGSGAFPMGILQQMVHILNRIDPDNTMWKETMMEEAISDTTDAYRLAANDERFDLIKDIERSFDESINRPDYARKLYLIENCIYGVDIQPIAIQISKLRFFISLVVDQITNNRPEDNFGIRPLPNLEAKFVAANTLIGINSDLSLADQTESIRDLKQQLKTAKHKIFGAKTVRTKRKYKQQVNELRIAIADELKSQGFINESETSQLASWDMLDQNSSSPFFDPDWMFGVKEGFDIVIANPPYGIINKKQNKGESISVPKEVEKYYKEASEYKHAKGGGLNIYRLFIIRSINLLVKDGIFSEIFQLGFAGDVSAAKTRRFIFENCKIDFFESFPERDNPKKRVFENAKMSVCILQLSKSKDANTPFSLRINKDKFVDLAVVPSTITINKIISMDSKYYTIPIAEKKDIDILIKVFANSKPFSEFGKCNTGEIDMTFCKDAFTKDSSDLKMLRGANIGRYYITDKMSQGETFYLDLSKLKDSKRITDTLYHTQRIIMQGITGVNEKVRLKMSISAGSFCANSVNYCTFKKESNLYFYLALFNSKLLNYIFKIYSTNSNVNGYEVDNLPIKNDVSIEKNISRLAIQILDAKSSNPNMDTTIEEKEIDRQIFQLYGLTYDEVKIVDPETPITEEEYTKEG